jgi:hypothetical protein
VVETFDAAYISVPDKDAFAYSVIAQILQECCQSTRKLVVDQELQTTRVVRTSVRGRHNKERALRTFGKKSVAGG